MEETMQFMDPYPSNLALQRLWKDVWHVANTVAFPEVE